METNSNDSWTEIEVGLSRIGEPLISLKSEKLVGFNSSFIRINNLGEMKRVRMFQKEGEDEIKIGFTFYSEGDEGNKLTKNGTSDAAFVSASALFNKYNLKPKGMEKTKFTPKKEMMGNEDLYYIEVPKNQRL